jgi:hypothetical protein
MMTNHAIQSPVNKHAEPSFMPPFHSARAICQNFGTFHFSLAGLSCGCSSFPAIGIERRGGKGSSGSDQKKGITPGNLVLQHG